MVNIQPLSQQDPRWSSITLGFGESDTTIGSDGCTLTCLTMVANGFGFSETPESLNEKLKNLGRGKGFLGALMVWNGLPQAVPGIVLANLAVCRSVPAPLDTINATLDAGKPVVVEVDRTLAPGVQNHWVVIYGRQGDDYLMHDPWPVPAEPSALLVQRYGAGRTAEQVITYVVLYDSSNTSNLGNTLATSGDATAGKLVVVVNDDPDIREIGGLRLRDAPVSGMVRTLLPVDRELTVQEPSAEARAKVAVLGQWLRVTDPDGAEGYVAAWYVHAKDAPPVPKGLEAKPTKPIYGYKARGRRRVQPPLR